MGREKSRPLFSERLIMTLLKKITLFTLIVISAHTLFSQTPSASPLQDAQQKLLTTEPSTWKIDSVAAVLKYLSDNPTNENKIDSAFISKKWNLELNRRKELQRKKELKDRKEYEQAEEVKALEELRYREKHTPPFSYEATDMHRMPKIIGEILQPLKEIQQEDLHNPSGKTVQAMPKRLTQKQRAELESIVRGAGLAYELLSLDNALAEISVIKPKTDAEKRSEARDIHRDDSDISFNKAEELVEESEIQAEPQREAALNLIQRKTYPEIEEQTLSYTRNKAYTLASNAFFKDREKRSAQAEPAFKKLLNKSFNTVLKGKSLGEQQEKDLNNARLAARFSQSKGSGHDSALASDVITTSKLIREFKNIASNKNMSQEEKLNRTMNFEPLMRSIRDVTLKNVVEKISPFNN